MNYPRDLIDSIRHQSLVPLVGAGISKPSGVPTWFQLLDRIIEDIEDPHLKEHAAKMLSDGRLTTLSAPIFHDVATVSGSHRRFQLLRDSFDGPFQPNGYHFALAELDLGTVVTTNYDRLIEMTWQRLGQSVNTIWRDDHLPLYDEKRAVQVVKMHGSVDDPDMVLTATDYGAYADRRPLIYQFISTVFATRTVLFLGASLTDPNLIGLLDRVATATRTGGRRHFAVMHEPRQEDVARLAQYGIEVIALEGPNREKALIDWLSELRRLATDTGETNLQRAAMFERALREEVRFGYPGDIVRMRASFGIISNPRSSSVTSGIYESPDQEQQELKIGDVTREFLGKNRRNVVRQIVHIDPFASMDKGYSATAVEARLEAMLEFMQEFPGQIELAHSPIPIETNQLIVGEREVISAYKYRTVGFTNATASGNRWVVRREADTFDRDFWAIRALNERMAAQLGIDTKSSDWSVRLSVSILDAALSSIRVSEQEFVLVDGDPPRLMERSSARSSGSRQHVIHLHLVTKDERPRVLLQLRSRRKRQYGGLYDVAVAGHQRSLDARSEAVREAAEELGLWIDREQLVELGSFEQTADGEPERVTAFVACLDRLDDLISGGHMSKEVSGLVLVSLDDLVERGWAVARTSVPVGELRLTAEEKIDADSLVPGLVGRISMVRDSLIST